MKLERQATAPHVLNWARRHLAGLLGCGVGLAAVTVVALVHLGGPDGILTKNPDIRLTVPFLVLALIAGVAAVVRREGAYVLPLAGIGLSVVSMILGWALVAVAVIAVAAIAILILSEMM